MSRSSSSRSDGRGDDGGPAGVSVTPAGREAKTGPRSAWGEMTFRRSG